MPPYFSNIFKRISLCLIATTFNWQAVGQQQDSLADLSYFPAPPVKFWNALSQTNRPLRILWLGDSVGADTVDSMERTVGALRPISGGSPFLGFPRYYTDLTGTWSQGASPLWHMNPFTLFPNATSTWHSNSANGLVLADTLSIYYLSSPDDGVFEIQHSTNGVTWTVLDTINAGVNSYSGFVTKSYELPLGSYQGRVVNIGTNKIDLLWLALTDHSRNSPQLIPATQGGVSWQTIVSAGSNSVCALLRAANPDLIVMEEKHDPATYTNGQPDLLRSWFNVAATNADVVYVGSHVTGVGGEPALTQDQNLWFRNFCITSGWSYVDGFFRMNNWSNIVANGWNSDNVHLNAAGRRYMGDFLMEKLGLIPKLANIQFSDGNQMSVMGRGVAGLPVVLQSAHSLDGLIIWENVATNIFENGEISFPNLEIEEEQKFFRVKHQ